MLGAHVDEDTGQRDPGILLLGMEAVSTGKNSTAVAGEIKNTSTRRFSNANYGYL